MEKERQETDCIVGFLPSLRIITYHSISDLGGSPLSNYGVPLGQFERQINTLLEGGYDFFDPAHLVDAVAGHPDRLDLGPDNVHDCYRDFSSCALPICDGTE